MSNQIYTAAGLARQFSTDHAKHESHHAVSPCFSVLLAETSD